MQSVRFKILIFAFLIIINFSSVNSQSLEQQFRNIFSEALDLKLAGSPGEHGEHFRPANVASSSTMINTLSNLINTNISAFPLSSTAAGLTFDFSSGVPTSTSQNLGPIFSERAQTLGKNRLNIGVNFSYLSLNSFRGTDVNSLRFSFTHEDVGDPGMGNSPNEFDNIDLFPNLDLNASILTFNFTYGVTNRFDIGIAIPMVNVRMKADPIARVNSFTYLLLDSANHSFGSDPHNPVLESRLASLNDDATGIGDLAIRAKYNFVKNKTIDFGALFEFRPATGDQENFLGAGHTQYKAMLIFSAEIKDFEPHLNLSYNKKNSNTDRDRLGIWLGYSQKLFETLSFALDLAGDFEIGDKSGYPRFPDRVLVAGTVKGKSIIRDISLSNIKRYSRDHLLNAAFGLKWNPKKEIILSGNIFVPLNKSGLRSDIIPTLGFEFSL